MDVVRSFAVKDCRIKIIEHDKNKGLAEARNTGLEHVSGDYVFFLDSDDWLSIDAIEKFVRSAKVGEPDIVVGQGLAFSDDDTKNTRIVTESVNLAWIFNKAAPLNGGSRFFHTRPPPHDANRYTENTSIKTPANMDLS